MTLESPLFEQNLTYSALQFRALADSLFAAQGVLGDVMQARQRAAGANMSVDVAAGSCVITGTDVSEQGKYLCRSSAVTNVAIATAPGAGNSRIDAIYARVRDSSAIGGAFDDWIIAAVTGTPASTGTETAPAIPASSLLLCYVHVGPAVSSIVNANCQDARIVSQTAIGAIKPELSSVQFGSLPPAGTPIRRISGTVHGACSVSLGASFLPTVNLTSLGLAYGYTAIVSNGDPQGNVVGVCAVSGASGLTSLIIQAFDPTGAALASGTQARANYEIVGA